MQIEFGLEGPYPFCYSVSYMAETYRKFEAGPDPFGRMWQVEFRWLQTGISIRHADTVDVKFVLWIPAEDGGEKQEKVIALPHPALLELSKETGHPLTDAWCMKLAGRHLIHVVTTGEDLEKTLVTANLEALRKAAAAPQAV